MKIIREDEVEALKKKGKITAMDGGMVRPVELPGKKKKAVPAAVPVREDNRQAKAFEALAKAMTQALRATNGNMAVLMEVIKNMKPGDVTIPEIVMPEIKIPEPAKEWKFTFNRDRDGLIDGEITAKRVE